MYKTTLRHLVSTLSERECEATIDYIIPLLSEMRIPAVHAAEDARRSEVVASAVREGFRRFWAGVVAARIG